MLQDCLKILFIFYIATPAEAKIKTGKITATLLQSHYGVRILFTSMQFTSHEPEQSHCLLYLYGPVAKIHHHGNIRAKPDVYKGKACLVSGSHDF